MLENLRLAIKRQKRLIIIFLLTIFVPSITLSIFGIRAIRNERFRLDKQLENEHRRAAEILKSQISSQFKELESILQNLSQSNAFLQRDEAGMKNLLEAQLADHPLVEHVFITFESEEPWFPLFQPGLSRVSSSFGSPPERNLQSGLKRAEVFEFKDKNYRRAISVYEDLANLSRDNHFKAQMLANISRCLMKAEDYNGALQNYQRICEDYPESSSSSGVPLALISRLQIISCFRNLGEYQNAIQYALDLYRGILSMRWPVGEAQFKTYASLVEDSINEIFSKNQHNLPLEDYKKEYDQLKSMHQQRLEQWMVVKDIRQEVIPDLRSKQDPALYRSSPLRYSKTIKDRTFLISSVQIPGSSETHLAGILGIKLNDQHLIKDVVPDSIESVRLDDTTNVVISDLAGNVLLGKKNLPSEPATATEFFENNFPPWRIEFFRNKTGALGDLDIKRNFYFWTILTLVVVLISGTVLISRAIAHEMAVLKLKSDFVSSVSHEFKSPLTSIKALADRLREGKVKDSDKMQRYYSLITQDVDRLTRLVRNILDFSKIEEGKREYEFVDTDVGQLVMKQIEDFKRDEFTKGLEILTHIAEDIPHLGVDREAFSQAFNNLLDNAVKFSPDRKQIEVDVKQDNSDVVIEVRDRGIGIPSHELNRIFDKFYQGRSTARQSGKGTGLGLTMVKHTVEAHGGRIVVESQVGEGSTFTIILPIQRKGK
ncbi:MAG: ATP-binding protein [Candidatus Aminicenantes bacterium]|nr:ATP-binding protein [Candidatus Aminicenantes bacterium]